MEKYTFDDMKKIKRNKLGETVPLELFRSIRLIGMYQGLPLKGKNTTLTLGREIGKNLPVQSVEEIFQLFFDLKIGIPKIVAENETGMHIAVKECFCEGLPVHEGQMVCDLEGAILEGALSKVLNRDLNVHEVKCNVNGDEYCEYRVLFND